MDEWDSNKLSVNNVNLILGHPVYHLWLQSALGHSVLDVLNPHCQETNVWLYLNQRTTLFPVSKSCVVSIPDVKTRIYPIGSRWFRIVPFSRIVYSVKASSIKLPLDHYVRLSNRLKRTARSISDDNNTIAYVVRALVSHPKTASGGLYAYSRKRNELYVTICVMFLRDKKNEKKFSFMSVWPLKRPKAWSDFNEIL